MAVTVTTSAPGVSPKTTISVSDGDYAAVKASILRTKSGDLLKMIDAQDKADMKAKAADKAPTVSAFTGDLSKVAGANAAFSVTATGTPSPEYRWFLTTPGGTRTLLASTTNALTLFAVPIGYNGSIVEVEVRNYKGTVTKTATLAVTAS